MTGKSSKDPVQPPVLNGTSPKEYWEFFRDWRDKVHAALGVPEIDARLLEALQSSSTAVQSATTAQRNAADLVQKLEKNGATTTPEELEAAKQANQAAKKAVEDAWTACQNVAVDTILDGPLLKEGFLSATYDDTNLVTFMVLNGQSKEYGAWCVEHGQDKAQQLIDAIQDTDLMRLFLESGGARRGKLGNAVLLHRQLGTQHPTKDPVLNRLALAVALELAEPYQHFAGDGTVTDAVQRYIHYEQAYLLGELDPHFGNFTVWELRNVVNSDASDDELGWGRQSLQQYRPDIALKQESQWQYCFIVKSDVDYKAPDWFEEKKSYSQILSGGGKCGPRAWYGRFICKAFGIPTWGCRQPGHAAMVRWTSDQGWVTCLGAGLAYSYWEDQCGLDFDLEARARKVCGDDRVYQQKVSRLEWIAGVLVENKKLVHREHLPDPKSPWYTLGMMQRRRLAPQSPPQKVPECQDGGGCCNKIRELRSANCVCEPVKRDENGTIIVPSTSCCNHDKSNKKVTFMKCFNGGQQLYVEQDGDLVYSIDVDGTNTKAYQLTLRVATAHRNNDSVNVTLGNEGKSQTITLPYSKGLWQETVPVRVDLSGPTAKLHFTRPNKGAKGFAFHSFKLVPAE